MKRNKFLYLAVIGLLSVFALVSFGGQNVAKAYTKEDYQYDETQCIVWEISGCSEDYKCVDTQTVLKSGNATFTFYELPRSTKFRVSEYNRYLYLNNLKYSYASDNSQEAIELNIGLKSSSLTKNVIAPAEINISYWGQGMSGTHHIPTSDFMNGYFANSEGKAEFDTFANGGGFYTMRQDNVGYDAEYSQIISKESIDTFIANCENEPKVTVKLKDIVLNEMFDLVRVSDEQMFESVEMKFFTDGHYYYCLVLDEANRSLIDRYLNDDYDGITNLYETDIEAYKIMNVESVYMLANLDFDSTIKNYEYRVYTGGWDFSDRLLRIFCVVIVVSAYVLLGIILPLIAVIMSIVKLVKKSGNKVRWIILLSVSGIAILFALISLLLMII